MPDCPLYDEKALLADIAKGNETAFRKLFDQYKERFYFVALKMTGSDEIAQDIVQDVFMIIWRKRESLSEIENPSAYFFTAVYRKVYQHYRKLALEKKMVQQSSPKIEAVNTTDEMVLANECRQRISQAITQLPPQQKLVFKLSREEGLSRDDVARQLKISPHTVKNHLSDALKYIRNFLRNSAFIFLVLNCLKNIFQAG